MRRSPTINEPQCKHNLDDRKADYRKASVNREQSRLESLLALLMVLQDICRHLLILLAAFCKCTKALEVRLNRLRTLSKKFFPSPEIHDNYVD